MASETLRVLMAVAQQFLEQHKPLQAIKCLQAICGSDGVEQASVRATVRLEVAELLLEHTGNVQEALKELETANWLLSKASGHASLKCSVLSRLVECQRHLSLHRQGKASCERALKICHDCRRLSGTREELQQWALHFRVALAELLTAMGEGAAALKCLEDALSFAEQAAHPDTKAVLLVGILQLHVQAGNADGMLAATQAAAEAVVALESLETRPACEVHLKLHFEVLRAAWLLSRGEIVQLQRKEEGATSPATVGQLEMLARASSVCNVPYAALPAHALPALAEVIAAAILRPTAKLSQAQAHLKTAKEFLRRAEAASGISVEKGDVALSPQHRMAGEQLAWVKFLIFENLAVIAITRKELSSAGAMLQQLMLLVEGFQILEKLLLGDLHLLIGMYCRETSALDAALEHFVRAQKTAANSRTTSLAAVEAATCLLSQNGDASAVPHALEMLKQSSLFGTSGSETHAAPQSAAGNFATALVLLRQGNHDEGRAHMMRALKLAHAPLHNHQLVARIMCALAPAYLEDDLPAVQSMANTALSLSKGLGDYPTQVVASEYALEWMVRAKVTDRLGEQRKYILKKQQLMQTAIDAALSEASQHSKISAWRLTPEALPPKAGAVKPGRKRSLPVAS